MNQKNFSEIKRRLNPDKRSPSVIRGCYISGDGQVISDFAYPVGQLPQEENEKYMALFRKTLSGTIGQNLLSMDFSNEQVMDSTEHKQLMTLVSSGLQDEEAVEEMYRRALAYVQSEKEKRAQSVEQEQKANNYLVLLLADGFDVSYRNINMEADREQSDTVFQYVLCCVCPVKQEKAELHYDPSDYAFHARSSEWTVGAPELGFLFPAYEDGGANIYRAMYYTRSASDLHGAFVGSVFHLPEKMTAEEQKETFTSILQESLADELSMNTVQAVHESICEKLEERKADKEAEPLVLNRRDVRQVLEDCGVPEERAAAFEEKYTETFGEQAEIPAVNMVTPKKFKVETPSVSIQVDPTRSDLIETRVIDGKYYILVLADGDVEVNGFRINQG